MADTPNQTLQQIILDRLTPEEERAAVERLMQEQPRAALSLLPVLLQHKHRLQTAQLESAKAAATLREALYQAPWHPATVVHVLAAAAEPPRVLVAVGNRRVAVGVAPGVSVEPLCCGTAVFLNSTMTVLLGGSEEAPQGGDVGVFSRLHNGLAVLKGHADEEIAVDLAADVRAGGLKAGDLLLYDRDSRIASARVDKAGRQAHRLEAIPDVTFDHIGGLDECLTEIRNELTLHVHHRELVRRHRLKPLKGIILSGPPGVGKTMIAKAVANHLATLRGAEATFISVKPGQHRAMWYGQTEERIRELFAAAREAASDEGRFAVMFFDDVDTLGARGDSAANTVDARVLPAFLAEIDGIGDLSRVWLIAATNRPDLLDEALLRPGRFGDKVFRIPRPNRQAARDILRKHLEPDLPFHVDNGEGPEALVAEMIEAVVARLYAPNAETGTLATLVFRDGTRRPLTAPEVMSGALLAESVAEAKRRSCARALRGLPAGLTMADLLGALDEQLRAVAHRLRPGPGLRQLLDLPTDLDVVKVETDARLDLPAIHHYMRRRATGAA